MYMDSAPSPAEGGDSSDRADEGGGRKKSGRDEKDMMWTRLTRLTRGILSPDITNQESLVPLKAKD